MRIATWNLEGKWSPRHRLLVTSLHADILLLTEALANVELPGMAIHFTRGEMRPGRRWAAIASRAPLRPLPDPHGATALADIGGLTIASSILPWRGSCDDEPWQGKDTAGRTVTAVDSIEAAAPVIWGGDWNHELSGRLWTGTTLGQQRILRALDRLGLSAPTQSSPHRIAGVSTIDHIALPAFWNVASVERVSGIVDRIELSDHDAYVAEVEDP